MSELRLYLRRDSLQEGNDCDWALVDEAGQVRSEGRRLEDLPRARRCRLILAGDMVLSTHAQLPDLPERRLAPLLASAAEASTLVDADSLHAVMLARSPDGTANLAVVDSGWLGRVLGKLAGMGLHPDSALPDYLLLPWTESGWSVGWLPEGIVARYSRVSGMALEEGDPPVSLILALAQQGRPEVVRVYLGARFGEPTLDRWHESLECPVEAVPGWDWRTAAWPDLPDLMQGRFASRRSRLDWPQLGKVAAWGLGGLVAIQMAGVFLDWALLANENRALSHEMRAIAERVLPAHAAVVDPAWQVSERLRELRSQAGKPMPDSLVGMLGRLGQAWPSGSGARIKALSFDANMLTLTLANADPTWLDRLKSAAESRGLQVSAQEDKDNGVSLSVRPAGKGNRNAQ